jgi:hypothetical protein
MSGYVASARIAGAAPRLARPERKVDAAIRVSPGPAIEAFIVEADPAVSSGSSGLIDRFRAARERWSQLTFFLLDPDSWR